jgi:hypothetical protein
LSGAERFQRVLYGTSFVPATPLADGSAWKFLTGDFHNSHQRTPLRSKSLPEGSSMKLGVLVAFAVLAGLGCAHSSKNADSDDSSGSETSEDVRAIQKRAASDLNCAAPIKVDVVEEGSMMRPWTFSASGCGQRATYLSRMGTIIRN